MKPFCYKRKWRVVTSIASALFIMASSPQILAHDEQGSVKSDGRFTPNILGAEFPPQPVQMENQKQYTPTKKNEAELRRTEQTLARVVSIPALQEQLGARYAHVLSTPFQPKGNGIGNRYRRVFFSHSNNQTVTVATVGNAIKSLQVTPAATEQPPLADSELSEAIELARNYWVQQGESSVNSLTGYAIQTFQTDGSLFPTRMVYVSFHENSPEAPLLVNNVDLTSGEVVLGE